LPQAAVLSALISASAAGSPPASIDSRRSHPYQAGYVKAGSLRRTQSTDVVVCRRYRVSDDISFALGFASAPGKVAF